MALEAARNIDVILFDKTGTLTRGTQGVVAVEALDEQSLLRIAAAVELESEHPIARAIVRAAKDQHIDIPHSSQFSALTGRGAKAIVDGRLVYVGSPQLAAQLRATIPPTLRKATEAAAHEGKTVIYVIGPDMVVQGAIMLADVIRKESKPAVSTLQRMGIRVAMLTGDSKGVAAWVARDLGITEYFAEVLPENKAAIVKQLQADGSRVAVVGDGINDAPALVQANIGIAIGAGTDVAVESAGIVLASNDPRGVASIVTLSKATYRKMFQNLWWAAGYNILAIPLAAGVLSAWGFVLSPALGAVLMSTSTIVVALNAQLLRKVSLR